jgi:hypothetical protein
MLRLLYNMVLEDLIMDDQNQLSIIIAGKHINTTPEIWAAFLNLSGLIIDTGDLFAYDDVFSKATLDGVQLLKNELSS